MTSFERRRLDMVERQLVARGVRDERVLDAMSRVPRECFVCANLAGSAYIDAPLPIDDGQTISQPYIVALMIEALALTPDDRVLEVGTGSGYAAAVLGEIAGSVFTVERHAHLAAQASDCLARLGYGHVRVRHGDGTRGWPEHAPFDAILVSAGGPHVPPALLDQLAIGGRLVIPIDTPPSGQDLRLIRRTGEQEYDGRSLGPVRFVPLVERRAPE
ncbi:MAG: protein-L-isoaspartate(D-aspartate) O-methyltransferase [Phycisphaerales bacterium]|nr:protein-L-isoaspartate(D-aspartate) O-methyltransferase [Phycisphaerales bacterium]